MSCSRSVMLVCVFPIERLIISTVNFVQAKWRNGLGTLFVIGEESPTSLQREGNVTVGWNQDFMPSLVDIRIYESPLCWSPGPPMTKDERFCFTN